MPVGRGAGLAAPVTVVRVNNSPMRRPRPGELIGLDVLAAAVATMALAGPTVGTAAGWLVLAGQVVPVAVRRLAPVPAFWVAVAASIAGLALGAAPLPFVTAAYVVYVVALRQPRRRWLPTPVIGGLSGLGLAFGSVAGTPVAAASRAGAVLFGVVVVGAAWTLGRWVRQRRADDERYGTQLAGRAVAEERLRIARERTSPVNWCPRRGWRSCPRSPSGPRWPGSRLT